MAGCGGGLVGVMVVGGGRAASAAANAAPLPAMDPHLGDQDLLEVAHVVRTRGSTRFAFVRIHQKQAPDVGLGLVPRVEAEEVTSGVGMLGVPTVREGGGSGDGGG